MLINESFNKVNRSLSGNYFSTQIHKGIEQVDVVVQSNSASAEEGAAVSEEILGQAELLSGMAAKFKLFSSI